MSKPRLDRMQIAIQPLALAVLVAFSATAARAHPKVPAATPATNPVATQPSTPLDLGIHPAATQPTSSLDPASLRSTAQPWNPLGPTTLPPAAQPSNPLVPTTLPPAAQPAKPLASKILPGTVPPSGAPASPPPQSTSAEVQRVVRWVADSRDNAGMPYLLIDKVNAQVFAFNPAGQLQGATPALLGMSRGDRLLAPNTATMAQMTPQVRITPAGRFVSRLAIDSHGKELLVLDYDASISLHAVVKGTPKEHRAERLNSPTAEDNRISFGCINVPTAFYTTIVSPSFAHTKGIVYVLPETGPASALFGFQPADAPVPGAQGSTVVDAQAARTVPGSVAR